MANALTGEFDVVAEFSIQAVNRILAAQHQDETYLHSIPAESPAEGLAWVRIDDTETGVHGIVQIQVSTPTVTLPAGEDASRVTIHYQLMAHIQADSESAAIPEFVHGEIQVTVDITQGPWEDGDVIEVDLGAEDLEVTFAPDPGAPLSDEETTQVNQIIRNCLMTGFDPVSSVVDLPEPGQDLRVQQWWFKTMPDDERPAVALLLNLTEREPEADDHRPEVFLDEEDDFAVAIGRDFLVPTLLDLVRDTLPRTIQGTARMGVWIPRYILFGPREFVGVTVNYTVTLNLDIELHDEPGEGRARLTVDGEVTTSVGVDGTFRVTQAFRLNADGDSISLVASDDPQVDLELDLPFSAEFAERLIADRVEQEVRAARNEILRDAGPLVQGLSAGFRDIFPGLRIPDPDVVYTAAEILAGGVIVRGTLDFGPWQDVVATFDGKCTWPAERPRLRLVLPLMFQIDLEQEDLSLEFRMIVLEELGFPLSDNPDITEEEENSRWRIDDQGRTLVVVRTDEALNICDPVDIGAIDWEFNALNSWIPGGTIQRFRWVDGDEKTEVHKFITRFTEEGLPVEIGEDELGGIGPHMRRWCLEVSGIQGSPPKEVSGWSCGIGARVGPRPVEDRAGGGFLVDVSDSEGGVVAHIDPWRPAVWSVTSRPGGPRPRRGGGANLVVHFPGSESTQTWSALRDALARRNRKDAAVFVVAVASPGLVVEPLKLEASIAWARTEDAEQAWAKAFRVTATPATFVVNPQGKTVWQHVGRLDAVALAAALDEYLEASGPLRWQQLHLKVRVGQRAPDFIFEYLRGRQIALRTLRGRPVLLNFWKSWSAPCLAELRHLQKLHDRFTREGWIILAINDERDSQRAREAFKENGFTFNFVADADRHIAQLLGVNCWPTTVSINEAGFVRHIQFGVTPGKGPVHSAGYSPSAPSAR